MAEDAEAAGEKGLLDAVALDVLMLAGRRPAPGPWSGELCRFTIPVAASVARTLSRVMSLNHNPLALTRGPSIRRRWQPCWEIVRGTGWDAVELRRLDFDRAEAAGQSEADVLDLVRR